MSDNPKLKKLDSKRIAISQKHELDYCRKIAKELSQLFQFRCEHIKKGKKHFLKIDLKEWKRLQNYGSKTMRLAKAFLEIFKQYSIEKKINFNLRKRIVEHEKRIKLLETKIRLPNVKIKYEKVLNPQAKLRYE